MSLPDTPNTQRERYYSVIAGQNSTDILPENPVSTENRYLDFIARNGGGGGGGGDTKIFTGTMAEWEALTPAEKAEYTHLMTTDTINTLAGYGITDAYTKTEVDALIGSETATTLFDGTIENNAYAARMSESILNFKRLYILVYNDDSTDFVHVSEIAVKVLEAGYDYGLGLTAFSGVHFFVNNVENSAPNGYMNIRKTSNGKATDFTEIRVTSMNAAKVKIIGIK